MQQNIDTTKLNKKTKLFSTVHINGKPIELKGNVSAKYYVILYNTFKLVCQGKPLDSSNIARLIAYSSNEIKTLGSVIVLCNSAGQSHHLQAEYNCEFQGGTAF